jgi:hypothetical protein
MEITIPYYIELVNNLKFSELESSSSRLAKFEKCEFTNVNDHFENEYNAEIGLYR